MCNIGLYFKFIKLIKQLKTPKLICEYMLNNFTYKYQAMGRKSPFQLYKTKYGDCNDFSHFATYIAQKHKYGIYQIRMTRKKSEIAHWLGVYVGEGFTYSDNQYYCFKKFNNFRAIVDHYNKSKGRIWLEYKVYDYRMKIIEKESN